MSDKSLALSKGFPVIVDVAIDPTGKKMYQVHESLNAVRKEMPLSNNFAVSGAFNFDPADEARSPAELLWSLRLLILERIKGSASLGSLPDFPRKMSDTKSVTSDNESDDDIWAKDVQDAFEEALAIVPKNGLNKIKIGGKSCGRNELISDFILARTGKLRLRKQVSSHIQVIKNMRLKTRLIALINDGPTFATKEEADENNSKFEEIFSKINVNKSIGVNSVDGGNSIATPVPLRRHSSTNLSQPPKRRKVPAFFNVRNISFSIESLDPAVAPMALTRHDDSMQRALNVKENAAISNRFPGLEEFSNATVPILHNMVRLLNPLQIPTAYSVESGLKTNYFLEQPGSHSGLSSFTTVYSFGTEVLNVNEQDFDDNTNQPFLLKFWKCFLLQIMQQPTLVDAAFKGITIKQLIYDKLDQSQILPKNKVKAVLLWEFSRVEDIREAVSSTSRLILPPTLGYATVSPNRSYSECLQFNYPVSQTTVYPDIKPLESVYGIESAVLLAQSPFGVPWDDEGDYSHKPELGYTYHASANVDLGAVRKEETFFY